jgi:hypothetical protein
VIQPAAAEALAAGNIPRSSVTPLSFKALLLELWCRGMAEATVAERGAADAA